MDSIGLDVVDHSPAKERESTHRNADKKIRKVWLVRMKHRIQYRSSRRIRSRERKKEIQNAPHAKDRESSPRFTTLSLYLNNLRFFWCSLLLGLTCRYVCIVMSTDRLIPSKFAHEKVAVASLIFTFPYSCCVTIRTWWMIFPHYYRATPFF